jgi:GTPase
LIDEGVPGFKSGFVTLVGRPNVGKSTLVNLLLEQKIAAVSHRPQTTRRKQLGILTMDDAQVIFMDTPGIHNPRHQLGEYMNQAALDTLDDADVIIWVVDASVKPDKGDVLCKEYMEAVSDLPPIVLALNKVDLASADVLAVNRSAYLELMPQSHPCQVSAASGEGKDALLEDVLDRMPEGPLYYDKEQITDLYEREIAADLLREAALLHLDDEVPHCVAVRIDEYTERGETGAYIGATIFVEKESQKGIVIGKKASMLKKIGATARQEIESMSGRKVYLDVRVKVSKNWRTSKEAMKKMGF